jgi:iron complex outermembrane receptor protein
MHFLAKSCSHLVLAGLVCGVLAIDPAFAQSAPDQPASADQVAGDSGLNTIVVTAQRRNENLQKVPITVEAFNAKQLEAAGITSTVGLSLVTPGLAYGRGVALGSPYLRGVGTGGNGPGVENTVAVYVDGVYYASKASAITDLENIERVEVLKGPQGTLFGRNASGGIAIRPLGNLKPRQAGVFAGGDYDISSTVDPFLRSRAGGVSLKVDHDFDFAQFVSTTAFRDDKYKLLVDGDATATPYVTSQANVGETQYSQEFQLSGGRPADLQWTTGVYLFDYSGNQFVYNSGKFSPADQYTGSYGRQRSQSAAVYGQATKEILSDTRLTLGGRYTWETRKIDGYSFTESLAGVFASSAPVAQQITFRKPTWRIALERDLTPDVLGYVSYNRGFKSGAFNTSSPSSAAVQPEVVDAYEAGLKTTLFDKKVRFNTSAFYYNFRNIQLTSFVGNSNTQILQNAARAKIYGVDGDIEFVPTKRLRFSASAEWLHAKYETFLGAPIATQDVINGGNTVINGPASGNTLIRAPKFSSNVMANYSIPVSDGSIDLNVSYTFTSKIFQEADNYLFIPPTSLVNGEISWSINDRYKASLWGRNITNKFYYANSSALVQASSGAAAEPRTYGVTLQSKF